MPIGAAVHGRSACEHVSNGLLTFTLPRPRLISNEQILSTMRACVLEHGPAVSLDKVAAKLHVSGPALLKRFGSREELMLHALRPPAEPPLLGQYATGPDSRPLEAQLVSHFSATWDFFAEIIPCIAALRESGIAHTKIFDAKRVGPLRLVKALTCWLEQAMTKGLVDSPALESAATAMLGAIQTRVFTAYMLKQPYSARSQREYLDDIARLFARALAPPRRKRTGNEWRLPRTKGTAP